MNRPPPLGESLEWAPDRATGQRWENLRYSIVCGWHSEWPTAPGEYASLKLPVPPFPITRRPEPVGDGWSDEG